MESHILLLRERARRFRDEKDEEDVYVWWGKIRSSRRQEAIKHLGDILYIENDLGAEDGEAQTEVQLYLTDYRSLYVAHVGRVTAEDPREDDTDLHIPPIYRPKDVHCDCWFQLWDIRRLVSDDTLAVVAELKKLRNTAYHDNPVSLYGGMVDLPLIVTRPDGARYFEDDVRGQLTGGKYWVEFDGEHSGIGMIERDLRENAFGEDNWARLDPAVRTFISTAERLYRDHRNDVSFDFSSVLLGFAKAFEVQANILLKQAVNRMRPLDRTINLNGKSVDLATGGPFMLGELERILGGDSDLNQALKKQFAAGGEWFTSSLYAIIKELAEIRNPAAHSSAVDRETVRRLRSRYVGVGCEGEFVRFSKVRPI